MEINDLEAELYKGKNRFENCIINFDAMSILQTSSFENINSLIFLNCEFNGRFEIEEIHRHEFNLTFKNCSFNDDLIIDEAEIKNLFFVNIKKIKIIQISGVFNSLMFNNKSHRLSGEVYITHCSILNNLNLNNFRLFEGKLELQINDSKDLDYSKFYTSFRDAVIYQTEIFHSFLGSYIDFRRLRVIESFTVNDSKFEKVNFIESDFGKTVELNSCLFNSHSNFVNCKNINGTDFKILNSEFKGLTYFDGSQFNKLEINNSTFERKVSFDSLEVKSIKIYQVTFMQGAFFDDIKINHLKGCDRKSIRAIKQEIQKSENRIDFNRFNNYEMATYYQELNWKDNFIDKSILFMTKLSTDFGNSWTKALVFILSCGLIFFTLFFITENYNNAFDLKNWSQFTSGFFRFFLVTDFYNPLETERVYLTNPLSWIIFIFGKIVIAFGIYEMIQSFRKFKA